MLHVLHIGDAFVCAVADCTGATTLSSLEPLKTKEAKEGAEVDAGAMAAAVSPTIKQLRI